MMTREELEAKIAELTAAASGLEEPDRTFTLNDIDRLHIQIEGMALGDIRNKLDQIQLPNVQDIDAKIAAARDATQAHQSRVDSLNAVVSTITSILGIVI